MSTNSENLLNHSYPTLKPAVRGGVADLTDNAKREILTLSGARPKRFLIELLLNWINY